MMREFLIFNVYGPLASWGEVAVGDVRSSELRPTRSALLGLIAAALGVRRDEEDAQQELSQELRFAVRVDATGTPIPDFHTVQVAAMPRGRVAANRAAEVRFAKEDRANPIVSRRHYVCDAAYTVVCYEEGLGNDLLRRIASALRAPVLVLSAGRKSCPLAWPLAPQLVEASSVLAALGQGELSDWPPGRLTPSRPATLAWEGSDDDAGLKASQVFVRRDQPQSRTRWTFGTREEKLGTIETT